MARPEKKHIITSQVEHSSVLTYCRFLEKHHGYRVTYLPVDREGLLSMPDLENALSDDIAVVSLMWANNETGVLFPVEQIAQLCRSRGVLYHCDAVQGAGKQPIDVRAIPFDYLSLTGHKIGGPKGIGALYVQKKAPFVPFVHGGHQERSRRGGTENVPYLIGLGIAAAHALKKQPAYDKSIRPLRDALEHGILTTIPQTEVNGHAVQRLANTTNITFHGIESEALLLLLDQAGICASSGSACLADTPDPSHVIAAMKPGKAARQSVRLSLGASLCQADITTVLSSLQHIVSSLRPTS
jgi:cysteine desulfurase